MISKVKSLRLVSLAILLIIFNSVVFAGQYYEVIGNVTFALEDLADGTVRVISAKKSSSGEKRIIYVDGLDKGTLPKEESSKVFTNVIAKKTIKVGDGRKTIDSYGIGSKYLKEESSSVKDQNNPTSSVSIQSAKDSETKKTHESRVAEAMSSDPVIPSEIGQNGGNDLMALDLLNADPYFGQKAVTEFTTKTSALANGLTASSDKNQFVIDHDLISFLSETKTELENKRQAIPNIAQELVSKANISDDGNRSRILNLVVETLTSRLGQRESAYNSLKTRTDGLISDDGTAKDNSDNALNWGLIGLIIVLAIIIIAIVVFIRKKKPGTGGKSKANQSSSRKSGGTNSRSSGAGSGDSGIVVRRRTTSILKKQSLDDVIGNPAYLEIDASTFITDSAVRKIYVKNSCIKDIYNMYAEDLRNPENPKEDGCMVVGRWVNDPATGTYDVSMEEVILPGDDAIFKEYELNFGGKIKMRVADKLRKLRRETNLQYDLICWIHSHPGLGVFFSNSDDTVHHQLKHTQHPNFLIAFVVDILTANQETGIFTFRHDGTVNSKNDLKKTHSLEEMYKWALESETVSFDPAAYYNVLQNAKTRIPNCFGVELNNSSIIDLTKIIIGPETGIAGWAVGTAIENNGEKEYVVSSIVRAADRPSTGKIGAVVKVTNFSLPTIQRLVWGERAGLNFVIAYATKTETLTVIPVINGEIINDENFHGEEKIDDLKTWTRRKR